MNFLKKDSGSPIKLKSTIPQKIGKVVLWVVVVFVILRGVGSFFRPVKKTNNDGLSKKFVEESKINDMTKGADAFAEAFVKEYLSYKSQDDDYSSRVSPYLANYLHSDIPQITSKMDASTDQVIAYGNTVVSKNRLFVDVKAGVMYTYKSVDSLTGKSDSAQMKKDIYLKVPVMQTGNSRYIISGLPQYESGELIGDPSIGEYNTNLPTAEDNVQISIKKTMDSFLKTYVEGSNNEIKYYLADTNKEKIVGLNSSMKYERIDDCTAYSKNKKGSYLVIVSYELLDPVSKQEIIQRITLGVENENGKYYISQINDSGESN